MADVKDFLHIVFDPEEFEKIRSQKQLTVEDLRRLKGVESMLMMVFSALGPYKKLLPLRMRKVYDAIARFLDKTTQVDRFTELAMFYHERSFPELFRVIKEWNKEAERQLRPNKKEPYLGSVTVPAHILKDASPEELRKSTVTICARGKNPYREEIRKRFITRMVQEWSEPLE